MNKTELLLQRLQAIADSLNQSGRALALLGLGSVGQELSRLDEYSDLDFFAIVEPGQKWAFVDHLDWLARAGDIAWCFKNTQEGYKLLYADGVFCEFAVFEPQELAHIPFTGGRIVWQRADFDASVCVPAPLPLNPPSTDIEWLVGEAVTNIYVGLGRYHRGEKLSAQQFIQNYAFQRILDLAALREEAAAGLVDVFVRERRLEQRYPALAAELPRLQAGYERIVESAQAALEWLDRNFGVNAAIRREILLLCRR